MAQAPRTDPHRPSALDPADYVFVGVADDHPGDSYFEIDHKVLAKHGVETGVSDQYSHLNVPFYDARDDGRPNYRCHHCGKHGSNIRYFIFFLHKPTQKVIVVGRICAKKLSLGTKAQLDIEARAAGFRQAKARHQWIKDHQDVYDYLVEYSEQSGFENGFFDALWEGLQRFGSLTDRQLTGLQKWMARGKPWAHEQSPEPIDPDRHQGKVTHIEDEPTKPQLEYIADLCRQLDQDFNMAMEGVETRQDASDLINKLKTAISYSDDLPQQPAQGGWENDPASPLQISKINGLMDERKIPLEARRETRRQLDAGLTKGQASRWINKLLKLPKI